MSDKVGNVPLFYSVREGGANKVRGKWKGNNVMTNVIRMEELNAVISNKGPVSLEERGCLHDQDSKLVSKMNLSEMQMLIVKAVELTYQNEKFLFDNNLAEWTVAFQLGYYLRMLCQGRLGEYSFDAEYNKATINGSLSEKYTGEKKWSRPDIIIHKRSVSSLEDESANILWVEIKRNKGSRIKKDWKKLEVVTRDANKEIKAVAGYRFGLSLLMPNAKEGVEYKWYMKGGVVK